MQFQCSEGFYAWLFSQVFLYLKQFPASKWRAVIIYPNRSIEQKKLDGYRELLDTVLVQRVYLDELPNIERKLDAQNIERFTGAGVYYGAATTEAGACRGKNVYIVGGGNSAGQAAMYLSRFAQRVFIVIRKPDLSSTMSQYLIDQISSTPNIELVPHSEIVEVCGGEQLEEVVIEHIETKSRTVKDAVALFVFIGAKPATDWLMPDVVKDLKGFVMTGRDLLVEPAFKKYWHKTRELFLLETSVEGVFAAGDVCSGAMNRVASAVGEGAMSIKFVHQYLAET